MVGIGEEVRAREEDKEVWPAVAMVAAAFLVK
jgi:hypothetical protein